MSVWSYQQPQSLGDELLKRWQGLLEQRTGICFEHHSSILEIGLVQRMREIGVDDGEQYFQQVSRVPEGALEWSQLVDVISVQETSFFREPDSFAAAKRFLQRRLAAALEHKQHTLDIWSVGCATGEEAYSLAILANDLIEELAVKVFLGVVASDISSRALAVARKGCYSERRLGGLEERLRGKYFSRCEDGRYQLRPFLRQRLCFNQSNILQLGQAPKIKMDLIFCQNVLVYFRRQRHQEVMDSLVDYLKPGGMLLIGPGEVSGWQHPLMHRDNDALVQAYLRQD